MEVSRIIVDYVDFGEDELEVAFNFAEGENEEVALNLLTINGANAAAIEEITHNHCYDVTRERYHEGCYDDQLY